MKRKSALKLLLIIGLILSSAAIAAVYINKVILPVKIKTLILETIEKETGKNASLKDIKFNIFRGLILSGLTLYDDTREIISIKEASCGFLILPIIKERKIIIPYLNLKQANIYLERGQDNSINLIELLPRDRPADTKNPFSIIVAKINLANAHIYFSDKSVSPEFKSEMENIALGISLSLPASIKFNLKAKVKASGQCAITAFGEFKIPRQELNAKISLRGLPLRDFSVYWQKLGFSIDKGAVNSSIALRYTQNSIKAILSCDLLDISAAKDEIRISLNSHINASVNHDLRTKQLRYSGRADILKSQASGIEYTEEIKDINAKLKFNNNSLNMEKITAYVFGIKIEAKAHLENFQDPTLTLDAVSLLDLKGLQKTLLERFKLALPLEITGQAQASVNIKTKLPVVQAPEFNGSLIISSAKLLLKDYNLELNGIQGKIGFDQDGLNWKNINFTGLNESCATSGKLRDFQSPSLELNLSCPRIDLGLMPKTLKDNLDLELPFEIISGFGKLTLGLKAKLPFSNQIIPDIKGALEISSGEIIITEIGLPLAKINGKLEFSPGQLKWSKTEFTYQDTKYTTNGTMKDFKTPLLDISLYSGDLSLEAVLSINDKRINISRLQGGYLDSAILARGHIDTTLSKSPSSDITAELNLDLKDIDNPFFPKLKPAIERIQPAGIITARVNLQGNLTDLKSCVIQAKAASPEFSIYGLNFTGLDVAYSQADRLSNINLKRLNLYEGTLDASSRINLDSENTPFLLEIKASGINLEKLKNDTPVKKEKLSGTLQVFSKLSGFVSDLSKLSGSGKALINQGKLWELNLFKGMGELIFTKDFANIVFDQAYCEFFVKDRFIFTENLILKSNLVNLYGNAKVGFDSSLNGAINVEMGDESAPPTGTFKDLTTALIGQAGKFAVIKLSGTLQKPEYKFHPAVTNVLKGIKNTILGSIFGE